MNRLGMTYCPRGDVKHGLTAEAQRSQHAWLTLPLPQRVRAPSQMQSRRRRERGRSRHQTRAPHGRLPEVELEAQRGQGMLEGRKHSFHLRHRANEDPFVQVPSVEGPT